MTSGRSRNWEQSPRKSDRIVMITSTGESPSRLASTRSCTNRCPSGWTMPSSAPAWNRNSSSNWSTTTRRRPSPSCSLVPRRIGESESAAPQRRFDLCGREERFGVLGPEHLGQRRAHGPGCGSGWRRVGTWRSASASPPGRENPPWSIGSTPAATSDDLPLPEAPMTATNRERASSARTSSTCVLRPKNRCDSDSRNGRSPGNGLNDGEGVIARSGSRRADRGTAPAPRRRRSRAGPSPRWCRTPPSVGVGGSAIHTAAARNGRLRPQPRALTRSKSFIRTQCSVTAP